MSEQYRPEGKTASENAIDQDLDEIEGSAAYSIEERADFVRSCIEELNTFDSSLHRRSKDGTLVQYAAADGMHARHFLLPGMPGGVGNMDSVREDRTGYRAEYRQSPKRRFIRVGQGEMWLVEKDKIPYLRTSTSECSTIVADAGDHLLVAHTSYSTREQTEAVATFLRSMGVPLEQAYGVVSTGALQKQRSLIHAPSRLASAKEYCDIGFDPARLFEFEYPESKSGMLRNVHHTLVSPGFIYVYSADYSRKDMHDERVGDYYDERIIPLG